MLTLPLSSVSCALCSAGCRRFECQTPVNVLLGATHDLLLTNETERSGSSQEPKEPNLCKEPERPALSHDAAAQLRLQLQLLFICF